MSFNKKLAVAGTPTLTLTQAPTVNYTSGSGSRALSCSTTPSRPVKKQSDLDYTSVARSRARSRTLPATTACSTLPTPGAARSLGANKNIVIDTNAHACTWLGSTSTWTTLSNWSGCASVAPQWMDDVVIPNTSLTPQDPTTPTTTVASVTINSGGILDVSSGTLTVTDDFTIGGAPAGVLNFTGGTLSIGGDLTDNGTISPSSTSDLVMTGHERAHRRLGKTSVPLRNLTINPGAAGVVTLTKNVDVRSGSSTSGSLTVSSGTLDLSTFTIVNTTGSPTRPSRWQAVRP